MTGRESQEDPLHAVHWSITYENSDALTQRDAEEVRCTMKSVIDFISFSPSLSNLETLSFVEISKQSVETGVPLKWIPYVDSFLWQHCGATSPIPTAGSLSLNREAVLIPIEC